MRLLPQLFENNRRWSERLRAREPGFFRRRAAEQAPPYLWIGCADSRVPANDVVDLPPGDVFVHRNIANQVVPSDLNALSVLAFGIEVLKVRHVIVCGHYGCGGVRAALDSRPAGLVDHWLGHVRAVHRLHREALDGLDPEARVHRLCELNVLEQARNVAQTPSVRDAWARSQPLAVHGWIYDLEDGLLRDLDVTAEGPEAFDAAYRRAVAAA